LDYTIALSFKVQSHRLNHIIFSEHDTSSSKAANQ
jgi:hypothetical protein